MHTITIASQKGGVGKTTTAVTFAHALACTQTNVHLADFDPQGHCATALGLDPAPSVFDYFIQDHSLATLLCTTGRPCLTLLPGNSRTRTAETVLRAERTLAQITVQLRQIATTGDWLVIDTPPSGWLQEAAIAVADLLIIPVRMEALAMDSLRATLKLVSFLNPSVRICILPTAFDQRINEHHYNWNLLKDAYPDHTLNCIPARVAVAEAAAAGLTIWEYHGRRIEDVRHAYRYLMEWLLPTAQGYTHKGDNQ